jgi:predicted DNA-binding protein
MSEPILVRLPKGLVEHRDNLPRQTGRTKLYS